MSMSALTIGTLRTTILLAREHPAPERVRGGLDAALTARLRQVLASAFSAARVDRDPSVWLVRRLELEANVNAAWEPEAVAGSVAGAIARSLGRALTGSGDGVNILRFDNRAVYLARFLVDRANGGGAQWYYRRFAGLGTLPTSAALRTALERDPALGLQALGALDDSDRVSVLAALSSGDAERLVAGFGALAAAGDFAGCLQAVAGALGDGRARLQGDRAKDALALLVAAAAPDRSGAPLVRAAALIARLTRDGGIPASRRTSFFAAIALGDAAVAAQIAPALGHLAVTLAGCPPATREAVAAALAGSSDSARLSTGATRFGGAFFLLPDLDRVDLEEVRACLPGDDALPLARLLVLAFGLRPDNGAAVMGDQALRKLVGLPPERDEPSLSGPLLAAAQAAAARLLEAFSSHLPGFAGSGDAYLRRNFLDVPATVDWEPARLLVRLGRPPLHVVLTLTGLLRRRYQLSWLDGLPVEVFPEE
jgi:hypothetical protein